MIRLILSLLLLSASFSASAGYVMEPYCRDYVFETSPAKDHSLFKGCLASQGITYIRYANSQAFYAKQNGREHRFTFYVTSAGCPSGQAPNSETGKCEAQCPSGQKPDLEGNCLCPDGSKPNALGVCEDYCQSEEFNQLKREKMILCNNKSGKFSYSCKSRDDVTFTCDEKDDGGDNGGGDNGGGGDSGGGNGSGGGSGSGGDNGGENPDPDKPNDNKDVIAALNKMNLDNNTRMDKLLAELEASKNKNTDELGKVKQQVKDASDTNHTDLTNLKDATDGVKNATDGVKNATNGVKNSVEGLRGTAGQQLSELKSMDTNLRALRDGILNNNDPSKVGEGVCNFGTCKSLYTKQYEDGLQGVLTSRLDAMKGLVTSGIGETFNAVDLGGASRPAYTIQMDFGFANYGSFDFAKYAHLDMVFTFLRAFFMACCMFYARSLVFGG